MSALQCNHCGYDLREHGLHDRCPECGGAVEMAFREHPWWSGERQVILQRGLTTAALSLFLLVIWELMAALAMDSHAPPPGWVALILFGLVQQALWFRAIASMTAYDHLKVVWLQSVVRITSPGMTLGMILVACRPVILGFDGSEFEPFIALFVQAATLVSLITMTVLLGWLARLMFVRRYAWRFWIAAICFLASVSAQISFTARLTSSPRPQWDGFFAAMRAGGVFLGLIVMLLTALLCASWSRILRQENLALGIQHTGGWQSRTNHEALPRAIIRLFWLR